MTEQAPAWNNPFARLPEVPALDVWSTTVAEGEALPDAQMSALLGVAVGADRSPHVAWRGAPESAKSFVVSVYDPDAPTGSGFWHWAIADVPASVSELAEGADDATGDGSGLPAGTVRLRNDAGTFGYIGAAPPAGHGQHRYFIVVSALDVAAIGVDESMTPARLGFMLSSHIVARGVLLATAETAPETASVEKR